MPSFRAFERIFSLNSGLSPLVVGGVLGFVWGFSGIVDDVPSTGRESVFSQPTKTLDIGTIQIIVEESAFYWISLQFWDKILHLFLPPPSRYTA